MNKKLKISFLGDVITPPFNRLNQFLDFDLEFFHYDIDQVFQTLMQSYDGDILIIHITSDFFFEDMTKEETLDKVDSFCGAINNFSKNQSSLLILNTLDFLQDNIIGVEYFKNINFYSTINSKIINLAIDNSNISLIDMQRIVSETGIDKFFNIQNRLMIRMPYTKIALDNILVHYSLLIQEKFNVRKKVLIVDADNTLWGGVVGEDGVQGVAINRDYPGLIFRRFQRQILEVYNSGILLVMVTKNNKQEINDMFDYHDMPLKKKHFIKIIANWKAKSTNISQLSKDLNLGTDSFVFIDDNDFELEEVRSSLPGIEQYKFDASFPEKSLNIIKNIKGFKSWSLSDDDKLKTNQYIDQNKRDIYKSTTNNIDEYLQSLNMIIEIGINRKSQIKRISNLTNKTNQFNLTTKRYSEIEIAQFMDKNFVIDIRLEDNFGDMGVIGVAIIIDNLIDTFLISCRAFGRKIEVQVLKVIYDKFKHNNVESIYIPSKKNEMAKNFYDLNGFILIEKNKDGVKKYRMVNGPKDSTYFNIKEVL